MRPAAVKSVAVGFFDGVHRGHRLILAEADAVVTFCEHPLSVVAPEKAPRLLMTCEERLEAIRACGIEDVRALPFTLELARLAPEDFVSMYLAKDSDGRLPRIVCGENWRFGQGGAADAAWLRAHGYDVRVVPYAISGGLPVSSSRIRQALEAGDITAANDMLGRRFVLRGRIIVGKGLGRALGYPTVNVRPVDLQLRLPYGVYEVELFGAKGVANYGLAPTCGEQAWKEPMLEVHLLTPPGVVPSVGEGMEVPLVRFIRPERTFDSLDALRCQIAADCASVRV